MVLSLHTIFFFYENKQKMEIEWFSLIFIFFPALHEMLLLLISRTHSTLLSAFYVLALIFFLHLLPSFCFSIAHSQLLFLYPISVHFFYTKVLFQCLTVVWLPSVLRCSKFFLFCFHLLFCFIPFYCINIIILCYCYDDSIFFYCKVNYNIYSASPFKKIRTAVFEDDWW